MNLSTYKLVFPMDFDGGHLKPDNKKDVWLHYGGAGHGSWGGEVSTQQVIERIDNTILELNRIKDRVKNHSKGMSPAEILKYEEENYG